MKKLVSIVCCITLLCAMMSACGSPENSSNGNSTASESVVSANQSVFEIDESSTTDDTPTPAADNLYECSTNEPTQEQVEASPQNNIEYPISDGSVTLNFFCALPSGYLQLISGYEESLSTPVIEEATGVKMTFTSPSEFAIQTQFDLLIAAGDYPDVFDVSMYTKGPRQAYDDGIIIALNDLLPEFAPDYEKVVSGLDTDNYNTLLDEEGNQFYMVNVAEEFVRLSGLGIRQDWLNELNLEKPNTIEELTNVLTVFHDTYGCDRTFHVEDDGLMFGVVGAFGVPGFDLTGNSGLGLYHDGNEVLCTLQSDGYYDYVQYMSDLYQKDLIHQEFYNFQRSYELMMNITCFGASGIWSTNTDSMATAKAGAISENPNYEVAGNPFIVADAGDTYEFASLPLVTTSEIGGQVQVSGSCISTACEDPEIAVSFINYFFTEEGELLTNWGIEGETFAYDTTGKPQYTDFILNNPSGITANNVKEANLAAPCAHLTDKTTFFSNYEENILNAIEIWEDAGSNKTLPNLTLNTEESDIYSANVGDICTFAGEQITKFIIGAQTLDKSSWTIFQDSLTEMGIENCVKAYQSAYDRYLSRA